MVLQPAEPLQSELDLRMLGITYGYSFWHGEKLELAATLGVTSVEIAAQAKVATEAVHINQIRGHRGSLSDSGHRRDVGAEQALLPRRRAQYLSLTSWKFDGSLGMGEIDALYRFRPNVSFAVGYTEVKAHLSSNKTHESGLFNFNTKGSEIFIRVAF